MSNNTALGAGSTKKEEILFISDAHALGQEKNMEL